MANSAEQIARVAHEVKRFYNHALGDYTNTAWDALSTDEKQARTAMIQSVLDAPEMSPSEFHQQWCAAMEADGWSHGAAKDVEAKTHPNLTSYEYMKDIQCIKDQVTLAIVRTMSSGE